MPTRLYLDRPTICLVDKTVLDVVPCLNKKKTILVVIPCLNQKKTVIINLWTSFEIGFRKAYQSFASSVRARKESSWSFFSFFLIFSPLTSYPMCSSSLYHFRGIFPTVFREGSCRNRIQRTRKKERLFSWLDVA